MTETTAYFFVAESLNNVIKHSRASAASVSLTIDPDGQLVVAVVDDGCGGATPRAGGGLAGMADRLAAAGGDLALSSSPGGGTSIVALLPGEESLPGLRSGDA